MRLRDDEQRRQADCAATCQFHIRLTCNALDQVVYYSNPSAVQPGIRRWRQCPVAEQYHRPPIAEQHGFGLRFRLGIVLRQHAQWSVRQFVAMAVGAMQYGLPPALGKPADGRQAINHSMGQHKPTGAHAGATVEQHAEVIDTTPRTARGTIEPMQPGIAQQLLPGRLQQRRGCRTVLAEESVRDGSRVVAWMAGIDDQHAATRSRQLQRRRHSCEAAANDDRVIGREGRFVAGWKRSQWRSRADGGG